MTIEDVLAAHDGIGYDDIDGCQCGAEFGSHDAHRTHVADAIRNHLLSAQVIDHTQNYVPLGFDPLRDPYNNTHEAAEAILRAALDAATNTHQEQRACLRTHAGPCFDGRPDLCADILTAEKASAAPECECPTDDYCPKCHPHWYAAWQATTTTNNETSDQ